MESIARQLLAAAEAGDAHAVMRCLQAGVDIDCFDSDSGLPHIGGSSTPLMIASRLGWTDVVERLLDAGANVHARNDHQSSPLTLASEYGHVSIVEMLLRAGASVEDADNDGDTSLIAAAVKDRDEVVKLLVAAGADVHSANKSGQTALLFAVSKTDQRPSSNEIILRTLMDAGANVNAVDANNDTALIYATKNGLVSAVKLLLDAGADVNHVNSFGYTALHWATHLGSDVHVVRLLEAGADYGVISSQKKTALDYARDHAHNVVHLLADVDESPHAFLAAVKRNDVTVVRKLVDRHANARGIYACKPLHIAARHGALDVLKLLVFRGASVHDRDDAGWTALHLACENGHAQVVQMLLAQGAVPTVKDEHGRLPIDLATWHGHLDIVRMLYTDPSILTNVSFDGRTALHRAAASRNASLVSYLLNERLDAVDMINATDSNGWTPLHHAVRYGDGASVTCLLGRGAATGCKTTSSTTPETSFLMAARLGDLDKLARLLDLTGIYLESRDLCGTALHVAVSMGRLPVASMLLEAGADVNAQDARGHTALLVATLRGDADAVQLLLQHGAKTDIMNNAGKTALDYVAKGKNEQLQSVLQLYHTSQQFHDRSLSMLSDPITISLDAVHALVPIITSVYDLRVLLTLVSVGGTALGSPQDASALLKAAFDYVVTAKLVLDDRACVYFKMALEHCEKSKLLSRNEFLLLDRQAEKANTESADWVLDLKKHVYANSARISAHDQCLQTVVSGLHELHAAVQENREAIKAVDSRVVSLKRQVAMGRRIVAQLVDHVNAQSDEIRRVQQRLTDSERAVANVTRRFNAFQSAQATKEQREARLKRAKKTWGIIASIVGLILPGVKEFGDMIIEYANPIKTVQLVFGESDVAAFVAETIRTEMVPVVEQQFFKFAIPTTEFETLLREEIVLQHPEILQECEQRQLAVSFDGGRGDAARELMPSLEVEEATLMNVLEQLRLMANGLQTEPIEPPMVPAVVVVTSRDNLAFHTTWQPPANVERSTPSQTKPRSTRDERETPGVIFEDDVEAFPFHAAVSASAGSLAVFTSRLQILGVGNNATVDATRAMVMAIPSDSNQATTETTRVSMSAAEYAYCLGYCDVGDFLASKMTDPPVVGELDRLMRVELAESVDDFPYVGIVDKCHGDVDEFEVEFELLEDDGYDLETRIQADIVRKREVAFTPVAWSAVEYASYLGYVDIVKFLVKEHCKSLPAKTRVQLLKSARERAASGA